MIRLLIALSVLTSSMFSGAVQAATASCNGKVGQYKLHFQARGSLIRKNDGVGFVKINGRVVAEFDGDAARISYLKRSFTIRNDRGDIVEGKLNNLRTGAGTLTRMVLPGERLNFTNSPVNCSMK